MQTNIAAGARASIGIDAGTRACVASLLWMLGLAGCAQIPTIPEPVATQSGDVIQVTGARGRLSQRETAAVLKRLAAQVPDAGALERHLVIEQTVAGRPLYTGNRVSILRDGPQSFDAMFDAIRHAQRYVYLEYYILEDVKAGGEQLSDLLIARRQSGVQIDMIYDSVGSLSTPGDFFARLQAAGIHVRAFNPINPLAAHFSLNERDHRKLLIADGERAIIGGVNLSTTYQSLGSAAAPTENGSAAAGDGPARNEAAANERWHDTDVEIAGPAVRELKGLFEQHWMQQGGAAAELSTDTASVGSQGDEVVRIIGSRAGQLTPRYYATLISAIRSATSRIWVTAAYFVPTHQEKQALARAARRGVDVRLLLPSHSDSAAALAVQHSHYSDLLQDGVGIYERDDGILHSKTMVADGVWSIVGSSNFDHRSVLFNDEVDAIVIGAATGSALERFFEQDLQHARRIELASWKRRPFASKLREHFWRLWEQLL